ncbi:PIG-L family deacetylase [Nocardioides acrostichi]|uniref:Bifunctional PIG-L family deacetylase/class I SAM-dependent methyltransferase n=1 Tax=Nocardioides acrostichi TaxID=2784339 RepID=A0A930YAN7_9ACTN|nr:bifunctional PIG-L family deacetylase/class I SAM-dependent methyltransferase [Nocardioides acrostichi]MBF4161588.1 bifunctional PIG-L family deacetylase/class I SAM-dependent methyltransferase [Nocardioides acrostichi]
MTAQVTTFDHRDAGTARESWRGAPQWQAMPALAPDWLAEHDLVLVVAAHPDDETLGAGGLLARAAADGVRTEVVVLTAGERSHPDSPTHSPERLARLRREELHAAVRALSPRCAAVLLGLPDGEVAAHLDLITAHVVERLRGARRPLVVAPWRGDGHPDHEAAGRAAATAAQRTDADLLEYPVWFWHWGSPTDAPWDVLRALPLRGPERSAKSRAMQAHLTQVAPLSSAPGDEVLLSETFLAHFCDDHEVFVQATPGDTDDTALDDLHHEGREPWGVDERWYEERKRALVLACLPWRDLGDVLEVGCSTGSLAESLAGRAERVLAIDSSPQAVASARRRLQAAPQVRVERRRVPHEWPEGRFDLVVCSEVGYFLSPVELRGLVARVRDSLTAEAVVLLCHWRHPVYGWPLDADAVHTAFVDDLTGDGTARVAVRHVERDVEVVVLATGGWPVADE